MSRCLNMKPHLACVIGLLMATTLVRAAGYDPLAIPAQSKTDVHDFTVCDKPRARDIPIRVYLPANTTPAPVVLFSHGLGGSREGSAYLGKHWAARGYATVFLQHPGSDTSVWKDKPLIQRMGAMREAANSQNFFLRVKDVSAVLDQLEQWNKAKDHALFSRLNLKAVGMSGHSFGALTAQAVSGQAVGGKPFLTDPRIAAALIMSPGSPRRETPQEAFGRVALPWLIMTGTKDTSMIGADMASRLAVFPALPSGHKYELVLFGAQHSAFTERTLPGEADAPNPNHHRAILALGTAFWDTYLRKDPAAQAWLDGTGPATVLEARDTWKKK